MNVVSSLCVKGNGTKRLMEGYMIFVADIMLMSTRNSMQEVNNGHSCMFPSPVPALVLQARHIFPVWPHMFNMLVQWIYTLGLRL